jgi:hypothetical protein
MASFNDEASVEYEALTDREDAEAQGSPIELHNMVNRCESKSNRVLVTITKRMQNHEQSHCGVWKACYRG